MRVIKSMKNLFCKFKITNPTMAESFGERLDKEIGDKYLNPTGFLEEAEYEEYKGIDDKGKLT